MLRIVCYDEMANSCIQAGSAERGASASCRSLGILQRYALYPGQRTAGR